MASSLTQTALRMVPRILQSPLRRLFGRSKRVPIGQVRFGDLRRLTPLSREWGFDRGGPVDRHYIESFLSDHQEAIRGRVLEFGDPSYTRRFGGERVTRSDVLNPTPGNPSATIVADLSKNDELPADAFDCIICTQTLQLFFHPGEVIRKLHAALRPGGVLLATLPGLSQNSDTHWRESWYWRFTPYSSQHLFADAFGAERIEVRAFGNVLATAAYMYGIAASELRSEELDHYDPDYDIVVSVVARKATLD